MKPVKVDIELEEGCSLYAMELKNKIAYVVAKSEDQAMLFLAMEGHHGRITKVPDDRVPEYIPSLGLIQRFLIPPFFMLRIDFHEKTQVQDFFTSLAAGNHAYT